MRSQATVSALISSEVHYTLSFGNIIDGTMQGMPFKIFAVLTDKPLRSLVSRPETKTIDELRGKRIGSQRIHKPIPLSQARDLALLRVC